MSGFADAGAAPFATGATAASAAPAVSAYGPPPDQLNGIVFHDANQEADVGIVVRLAGGALVLLSVMVIIEQLILPKAITQSAVTPPIGVIVSTLFDLAIGGSLLFGSEKLRSFAIFRMVMGTLLFGGAALFQGNFIQFAIVAALAGGFLLLLVGEAPPWRAWLGLALVGACLALELLGILILTRVVGNPFLSRASATVTSTSSGPSQEVEALLDAPSTVTGYDAPVRIDRPGRRWRLRPANWAQASSPETQIFLLEPASWSVLRVDRFEVGVLSEAELKKFGWKQLAEYASPFESFDGQGSEELGSDRAVDGGAPPIAFSAKVTTRGSQFPFWTSYMEVHARPPYLWTVYFAASDRARNSVEPDAREAMKSIQFD